MGGCCDSRSKYDLCDSKETLHNVLKSEMKNYEEELEMESNIVKIDIFAVFIKNFREIISEVSSRKFTSIAIDRIKRFIIKFTDYWDNNKKIDDQYKKNLSILKEALYTQKLQN